MSDIDKTLLGTEWIKVAAKHHGQKARIDKIGPRGPRMKLIETPGQYRHGNSRGGSQPMYQRLDWWELGNNWKPLRKGDELLFLTWQLEVAEEKESMAKPIIESETPIVDYIAKEGGVPETVECHRVYHSGNTTVPTSQAYLTKQNNWWCLECKAKREKYEENRRQKKAAIQKPAIVLRKIEPAPVAPEPLNILPPEILPQWKVTVIQPTEHIVYAKDFLDAAAQLSTMGEIVRVEKI